MEGKRDAVWKSLCIGLTSRAQIKKKSRTVQHPGAPPALTWDKPMAVSDPVCSLKGPSTLKANSLCPERISHSGSLTCCSLCRETSFLWPPLGTLLNLGAMWVLDGIPSTLCHPCMSCSGSDAQALMGNVSTGTWGWRGPHRREQRRACVATSGPPEYLHRCGRATLMLPLVVAAGSAPSLCELVVD